MNCLFRIIPEVPNGYGWSFCTPTEASNGCGWSFCTPTEASNGYFVTQVFIFFFIEFIYYYFEPSALHKNTNHKLHQLKTTQVPQDIAKAI